MPAGAVAGTDHWYWMAGPLDTLPVELAHVAVPLSATDEPGLTVVAPPTCTDSAVFAGASTVAVTLLEETLLLASVTRQVNTIGVFCVTAGAVKPVADEVGALQTTLGPPLVCSQRTLVPEGLAHCNDAWLPETTVKSVPAAPCPVLEAEEPPWPGST